MLATAFPDDYKPAKLQFGVKTRLSVNLVQSVGNCKSAALNQSIFYRFAALRRLGYRNFRGYLHFVLFNVNAYGSD